MAPPDPGRGVRAGRAAGIAVTGAGAASATVDPNTSYNNEPDWNGTIQGNKATAVLSLSIGQAGGRIVQVNGNAGDANMSADNGIVSLWDRVNTDNDRGVLQANEQWEFVPEPVNTGATITTGYGWLRNRMSGKCLDVTGAPAPGWWGAPVAQYTCVNDLAHPNQLWTLTTDQRLKVKYSGQVLVSANYTCGAGTPTNGTRLFVFPDDSNTCSTVTATPEKYRLATNRLVSTPPTITDNATYRCLNNWLFRSTSAEQQNQEIADGQYIGDSFQALGSGANFYYDPLSLQAPGFNYNQVHVSYNDTGIRQQTYQGYLFCEPAGVWLSPIERGAR